MQDLLALSENPDSAVSVHQGAAPETKADQTSSSEPTVEATVDTPRKKKKKKDKIKEETLDGPVTITAPELNESTIDAKSDGTADERKKKKKKKKTVKEEDEEMQLSAAERNGSDSSGYHSDKSSRKRTWDLSADTVSEESRKSKKKKRESGTEQPA